MIEELFMEEIKNLVLAIQKTPSVYFWRCSYIEFVAFLNGYVYKEKSNFLENFKKWILAKNGNRGSDLIWNALVLIDSNYDMNEIENLTIKDNIKLIRYVSNLLVEFFSEI
jgi:hypothetical protein